MEIEKKKEIRKAKAFKFLKGFGIGLGLVGLFFLGIGVGGCAERNTAKKNQSEESSFVNPTRVFLEPKKALSSPLSINVEYVFDEDLYLDTSLDDVYYFDFYVRGGDSYSFMKIIPSSSGGGGAGDQNPFSRKRNIDIPSADITQLSFDNTIVFGDMSGWYEPSIYRYITFISLPTDSGFVSWLSSVLTPVGGDEPESSSSADLSPLALFNFPRDITAYPLIGEPTVAPYVLYQGSENLGEFVDCQVLGVTFRSNGVVYNTIQFGFTRCLSEYAGTLSRYGYYDDGGHLHYADELGNYVYFLSDIIYMNDDSSLVVASRKVGYGTSNANNVMSPDSFRVPDPDLTWLLDDFRSISILSISEDAVVSHYSGLTGVSVLDWFQYIVNSSRYSVISGVSFSDVFNPFSLIKSGFDSILGLFNLQILPNISLGGLIFAPLIVVIIMAIIKVLQK